MRMALRGGGGDPPALTGTRTKVQYYSPHRVRAGRGEEIAEHNLWLLAATLTRHSHNTHHLSLADARHGGRPPVLLEMEQSSDKHLLCV